MESSDICVGSIIHQTSICVSYLFCIILDDLDRAYESVVNTTVAIMEQNEKVSMAFDKYYAKIQRIGAGRAELANAYADRKDKVELVPKNAVEKMISERDAWKAAYTKSFAFLLK